MDNKMRLLMQTYVAFSYLFYAPKVMKFSLFLLLVLFKFYSSNFRMKGMFVILAIVACVSALSTIDHEWEKYKIIMDVDNQGCR
ncbi:hypothetical protein Anas_11479 [Armadillidium nasatum]|uniref:Uncharacterized protein n=1 Tax=Armadillidium nasatum TaxID=96803 RepID=A0A5N5T4A0_9CRUS|nr:hypothetical protein Anas_11479 [Armadillidium nasatum]